MATGRSFAEYVKINVITACIRQQKSMLMKIGSR